MRRSIPARPKTLRRAAGTALCAVLALAGCDYSRSSHIATSVVDYLYPHTRDPVVTPQIPVLTLPMRVGVAFVPAGGRDRYEVIGALTENKKAELLQQVVDHFEQKPFVASIEVIPSAYLRPGGSFANLDQLRTIYRVEVMALVSYDQAQFTDQGLLSLTYWTLVGAYIVPGEKNDTHTMLDTAVYDIASRKLLFRAPGTHHVKGRATPVNLSRQLREDSETGFHEAAKAMIANLDEELERFTARVRERPAEYKVVEAPGYKGGGGGGVGVAMLALVAALAAGSLWRRRDA